MKETDALIRGGEVPEPPVPVEVEEPERKRLNVMVLLALSAGAAFLLGRMLWPFMTAIISALVLAVLAHPAHARLERAVPHAPTAALVSTTLLFLLVMVPLLALSLALFNSLQTHAEMVADEVGALLSGDGRLQGLLDQATEWLGAPGAGLAEAARNQLQDLGGFLAGRTVGILSGLGGGMVQAGVALFTLFYLLLDGRSLMAQVEHIIPLDDDLTEALVARSGEIIHATMYGNVVVGIAQGALTGIAFWLLDIPGAVLWGSVVGVLGLIPILGSPVVWGPAVVILLLQGEVARGLILALVGTFIVSTVDNILRATVVSDRAQLHPLVVFFSALGGILLFGMVGIFLGPVLFVISISILEVTRLVLDPESRSSDEGSDGGSSAPSPETHGSTPQEAS